jgi:hypothetical protein
MPADLVTINTTAIHAGRRSAQALDILSRFYCAT